MNSYEQHAQHMVDEGVWTPEEAESWVGNTMYADWRDFQAELELEAREVECDEESEEEMSYRTIEEKFLADFERLERENEKLAARVAELEELTADKKGGNFTLDALVRAEGRRKVFFDATSVNYTDVGDKSFEEWREDATYGFRIPKGVSNQEFFDYFAEYYESAYERKVDEELETKGGAE